MDRLGRRAVAVPAMVIMGTCFGLLPLTSSVVGVAVDALALGFGNGISSGVVLTLGADASPAAGRNHFLAGWRLTTGLGQAAGPLLVCRPRPWPWESSAGWGPPGCGTGPGRRRSP